MLVLERWQFKSHNLEQTHIYIFQNRFFNLAGDNSEEAIPDPIPNSEVKLFCVDGTAWEAMWESRSSPAFFVFVLGWRTYCVSCATHVVETYGGTSPRTFELASLYLHPAKHKKVSSLCIDTHKINLVRICSE